MRRTLILLLLLMLTGCTARDPLRDMTSPPVAGSGDIPVPVTDETLTAADMATLWFQLGTEPYLAPEYRTIPLTPTEPYETSLLRALLSGPVITPTELRGLFPAGTRVTATYREGRRLFVTLTRHIMNDYPDEASLTPREAALRRQLAMQAIAATVTENAHVDEIIILVEQGDSLTDSLRLRRGYYRHRHDDDALAAPLTRDETLLLTHGRTMMVILQAWAEQDWVRLYTFVARTDPNSGQARPDLEAFITLMDEQPPLTASHMQGTFGSIDATGRTAVFPVDLTLLIHGRPQELPNCMLRLHRERGIWRIGLSEIINRWEDTP